MKKLVLLFCFVLLISPVLGKELLTHDTVININEQGDAEITERFVLSLNEFESSQFEQLSQLKTMDVSTWNNFYYEINTYAIGEISSMKISTTQISGGQFGNEVRFEYEVAGFATKVEEVGRHETYSIDKEKLRFYDDQALKFILPGTTDLTISLPESSETIELIPEPWITIGENTFRWVAGTFTSEFRVKYQIEKDISESFDIGRIVNYFVDNPLYGIVILIIIALTVIYRKQIFGLISESFAGEGEVEMPKKEL